MEFKKRIILQPKNKKSKVETKNLTLNKVRNINKEKNTRTKQNN